MTINLVKGQRIVVNQKHFTAGLGWDPAESGYDFDLDASVFMLGENGKLPQDEFFVFYNNQKSPDGSCQSTGDDLTGGNSDGGDDEQLIIDLDKVSPQITSMVFVVTIYDASARNQNFGQVQNSYIRFFNTDTEEEIARYDLCEDFSTETAIEFGRLYKRNDEWKFEAIGRGYKGGLQTLVTKYRK